MLLGKKERLCDATIMFIYNNMKEINFHIKLYSHTKSGVSRESRSRNAPNRCVCVNGRAKKLEYFFWKCFQQSSIKTTQTDTRYLAGVVGKTSTLDKGSAENLKKSSFGQKRPHDFLNFAQRPYTGLTRYLFLKIMILILVSLLHKRIEHTRYLATLVVHLGT